MLAAVIPAVVTLAAVIRAAAIPRLGILPAVTPGAGMEAGRRAGTMVPGIFSAGFTSVRKPEELKSLPCVTRGVRSLTCH
jgi:hypothetical protein